MPRSKKNKRNNYQDVLITRLMQISLKMDDHIYNNALISVTAAKAYLQEIASLKLKCPRTNLRTLQVIEKLTRCMKSIMNEDQGHVEYQPVSPVKAYTKIAEVSSPVYSLPDEDRTEVLTQYSINDYVDDQIIDLTENDEKTIQEPVNLIEKVKIAISKMGLRNEPEILIEDDDCSQSILENFQNDITTSNEINKQSNYFLVQEPNNQTGKVMNEVNETTIILPQGTVHEKDCSQSVLGILNNENTKCSETSQERELEIYQYITKRKPVTQPAVTNDIKKTITINNTTATQQSTLTIEVPILDLNKETSAKVPSQVTKKENKKGHRKKNKDNNEVKRKSQPKVKNTAKASNKEKHVQRVRKPFNIVFGEQVVRSNISVDKPERIIYNKNVECDLSWVENLRYVREINPEENDQALSILDDTFWNNFSLPSKWNDKDFEI